MEQLDGIAAVDRLSELHLNIITRILSVLPTKSVIQTSVLSKRWRYVWTFVPAVDFDHVRDVPHGSGVAAHERYVKLISHSLERRHETCEISKFKLYINFFSSGCQASQVDRWLRFPLERNVKELDLLLANGNPYCVPRDIFRLRNLVVLKLDDVLFETQGPLTVPRLKVLHLLRVGVEDHELRNVLLGCVSIEELVLEECFGLCRPHVSSLSLKSMEVQGNESNEPEAITIEAPNLLSFGYKCIYDNGMDKCNINLSNCKEIRKLSARGLSLSDQWFEDLMSRAPLLENLNIVNCDGFQHIRISYEHLKKFGFASESRLAMKTVTIDAPSLVFFHFAGVSIFNISVNTPNLREAKIEISNNRQLDFNMFWYVGMLDFLSKFNGCNVVRLFSSSVEAISIPPNLTQIYGAPFTNVEYLHVTTKGRAPTDLKRLRQSLNCVAPNSKKTFMIK